MILLAGCGDSEPETLAAAQPITDGDSCHVCGMLITEHPGPKGEAFVRATRHFDNIYVFSAKNCLISRKISAKHLLLSICISLVIPTTLYACCSMLP